MNPFKLLYKDWNRNFNKGMSIFQICLMLSCLLLAFQGKGQYVPFFTFICLFGYLEPNQCRFAFKRGSMHHG